MLEHIIKFLIGLIIVVIGLVFCGLVGSFFISEKSEKNNWEKMWKSIIVGFFVIFVSIFVVLVIYRIGNALY